jgi:ABC-type Fe2+-enterobactin transport system substrate-binding protein
MLAGNPFLKQLPPVKDGQIYALGPDTFRLDYYSASLVLDRLATLFGQKTPAVPHA